MQRPGMLPRLLTVGVLLALAAFALRHVRRGPQTDMRLALKRHSQSNRAYRFGLPPMLRPK